MNSLRRKSAINPETDTSTLPVEDVRRDSPVAALFVLVFSGITTGVTCYFLFYSIVQRAFRAEILIFIVPVLCIGMGLFLLGLNMVVRKSAVIISPDTVTVRYSSLFRKTEWSEPLPHYDGICHENGFRGDREHRIIILHHPDRKKTIELALYRTEGITDSELQEKLARYSAQLHLPLVTVSTEPFPDGSGGRGEREIAAAGRPISTLKENNVLRAPEGLLLEFSGDTAILTVQVKKSLSRSTLFQAAVAAVIMAAGFHNGFSPSSRIAVLGFFGAIIGVYILIFVMFDLMTRQRIKLHTGGRICILRNTPLGDTKGTCFNTADIRSVAVEKGLRGPFESLYIVSEKETIHFGEGLNEKTLQWLKEYLQSRL